MPARAAWRDAWASGQTAAQARGGPGAARSLAPRLARVDGQTARRLLTPLMSPNGTAPVNCFWKHCDQCLAEHTHATKPHRK